jgi:hypothetical protein
VTTTAIRIDPTAFYPETAVIIGLDIPSATLTRAKRTGDIRFRGVGNRTYYLGRWLLDWLEMTDRKVVSGA